MRLTRRGLALVVVCLTATAMFSTVGQVGLAPVALGSALVVVAGAAQALWFDPPTVERIGPTAGHVGDRRSVELRLSAPDPYLATVRDRASPGLPDYETDTTVGGDPVAYEVDYEERGVHHIGPVEVEARDTLGLFTRTFDVGDERTVLVYPRIRAVAWAGVGLTALVASPGANVDREFDHLREYRPGDSPRDVDWRATAKRDELIVAEYEERGGTAVLIAAGGPERHADTLAEAVASVALRLLDAGVPVGVRLPDEQVPADEGGDQRERILAALARTEAGPRPSADAGVEVTVRADGRVAVDTGRETTVLEWPPTGRGGAP